MEKFFPAAFNIMADNFFLCVILNELKEKYTSSSYLQNWKSSFLLAKYQGVPETDLC